MTCRKCGTEIADKALVCFKCGAATTEPVHAPPPAARTSSTATLLMSVTALILMVGAAFFITRSSPDAGSRTVTWVFAAVAVAIVVLRAYARRR